MSRRCELTGKAVQSGNKVSHSNRKTRTRFLPNLVQVTLVSDALERSVRLRVSAAALRSVEHRGGLDDFLVKAHESDLSEDAVKLKREIAKKRAEFEVRSRLRLGRARYGPAADRFPLVANFAGAALCASGPRCNPEGARARGRFLQRLRRLKSPQVATNPGRECFGAPKGTRTPVFAVRGRYQVTIVVIAEQILQSFQRTPLHTPHSHRYTSL